MVWERLHLRLLLSDGRRVMADGNHVETLLVFIIHLVLLGKVLG
jgi:hypothetical protein